MLGRSLSFRTGNTSSFIHFAPVSTPFLDHAVFGCFGELSGQVIRFHQPRFPWNWFISVTEPPFGVRPYSTSYTRVSYPRSSRHSLPCSCGKVWHIDASFSDPKRLSAPQISPDPADELPAMVTALYRLVGFIPQRGIKLLCGFVAQLF